MNAKFALFTWFCFDDVLHTFQKSVREFTAYLSDIFYFTILCECIAYHLDTAHVASAGHSGQGQLMDHAGDLGDDYKFGQDQVFPGFFPSQL